MTSWRPGGHGNVTHVDPGALQWAIEQFGVESMWDLGCGPGGQVLEGRKLGMWAAGFDADMSLSLPHGCFHVNVSRCSIGAYVYTPHLVWSCEVAEHIDPLEVYTYIGNLCMARSVILLTANPNPGQYHCNPQPVEWWIERIEDNGTHRFDAALTDEFKQRSTMRREFVRNTGMCFVPI